MSEQERIVADPTVLVGKPVIRGTRLAVEFVIDLLAQGWSAEQIIDNYPGVEREDIAACLRYATTQLLGPSKSCFPFIKVPRRSDNSGKARNLGRVCFAPVPCLETVVSRTLDRAPVAFSGYSEVSASWPLGGRRPIP